MNILYYLESKSGQGGVANVAYYLPRTLAKKEVDVTYYPRIKSNRSAFKLIRSVFNLINVNRKFLSKEFNIIHFNYVPTWSNGGYILLKTAKTIGIPTVLNIHGIIQLEHKSIPFMILPRALSSCKLADKIVVNTEFMRAKVGKWYGISHDKMIVIPNGVSLDEFTPCKRKIKLEGDPAILNVGWCSKIKGFDVLAYAVSQLKSEFPNMKLHVLGGGYERYLPLLRKEGIEKYVVFHGMIEHSIIPTYFRSVDICIIPSRHEGFPITLLEAMASGIPVIASNIGSLKEIISNGENGILFESENTSDLSKAILNLHRDEDLKKKISNNALKTAEKYSWESVANKYISLYTSLAAKN